MEDLVKGKPGPSFNGNNCEILRQIILGLEHLHAKGFIHRDLNPRNIFVSFPSGTVDAMIKLADFGISRSIPENKEYLKRTVSGSEYSVAFGPCGTEGWMAPEIKNNATNYTNKIDIYSSALVFGFTLCKGFHPFSGTLTVEQLRDEDRIVYELIQRMLDEEPKKRPSAKDILKHKYFKVGPNNLTRSSVSDEVQLNAIIEKTQISGVSEVFHVYLKTKPNITSDFHCSKKY